MMLCPTPEPCHCIGNDIIYCAYRTLSMPPYFLEFYEIWQTLNLSDNLLKSLPEGSFKGVRVRTIDLTRNLISDIHPTAFQGTENVYTLDLSHNHLSYLARGVLAPLTSLTSLKLRYNRFRSVNADAFRDVSQLVELDLSGNSINTVPSEALRHLYNLKRLWLRNNKLKTIGAFAFPALPLELLDLGSNDTPVRMDQQAMCSLMPQISHAEPNVKEWSGMQTLRMDHNGLSHLDPCIAKLIWTLQEVDISGNPLRCDCRLYLLRKWGTRTTFPNAQCAAPFQLAGEYVNDLENHKLNCTKKDLYWTCENLCPPPTPRPNINGAAVFRRSFWDMLLLLLTWIVFIRCSLRTTFFYPPTTAVQR